MGLVEAGIYGIIGDLFPELLALYNLRYVEKGEKPHWVASPFYWIITIVMILVGGATVLLYKQIGINVNELMALHLGMATPILITTMTKEKPKID